MVRETGVLIAGGGPGGLAAAEGAARAGAEVAVFEKNPEIGSPTRTSGGSFIADLEALGIPTNLYHPLHRCRFVSPRRSATFEYPEPVACAMDVRRVYQFLAERAILAGAQIFPATQVIAPLIESGRVNGARIRTVRGEEIEVRANVTIDASGHRPVLLKAAGVIAGHGRFGVGAEYDLYARHFDESECVLMVGSQVAPCGYAWALPYGGHRVRLGVGVIHPDCSASPGDYLNRLVTRAADFEMDLRGAQPVEYHTGLIPSDGLCERLVGDGIMGAGDAAGQPSALLGEGIRWAIYAGQMAGAVAAEAIRAGDCSACFLSRYETQWRAQFGTNLRVAHEINQRIAAWSDERWDWGTELLARLTPAQFAQALRSDLTASWAWGVFGRNPGLIKAGAAEIWKRARGKLEA